jgi:hypothetical protein
VSLGAAIRLQYGAYAARVSDSVRTLSGTNAFAAGARGGLDRGSDGLPIFAHDWSRCATRDSSPALSSNDLFTPRTMSVRMAVRLVVR